MFKKPLKVDKNCHSKIFIFGQMLCQSVVHAHIWAYIFWQLLNHFGPIGLKNFMGAQETVIYRLVISFLIFWVIFGRKIGVATPCSSDGLGPPNRPKSWLSDLSESLGPTAISKSCFRNFKG